jgi:hypothetical protein
VVRHELRVGLGRFRKTRFEGLCDVLMKPPPRPFEQGLICSILDERLSEGVVSVGRNAQLIEHLGLYQLGQFFSQGGVVEGGNRMDQLIRELPSQSGAELNHLFDRPQAVQPGHERVLQCGGDGQLRRGPPRFMLLLARFQQPRFQYHLRQFFDEQRYAVGFRNDLIEHLAGQSISHCDLVDELLHLMTGHPPKSDFGLLRSGGARRPRVGSEGEQDENPGS